jgi:hypothetical protein
MHRALYPICGQDAPIAQRALLWGIVCSTGGTPAPQLLFAPQLFSIFGLYDLAAHQLSLFPQGRSIAPEFPQLIQLRRQ